ILDDPASLDGNAHIGIAQGLQVESIGALKSEQGKTNRFNTLEPQFFRPALADGKAPLSGVHPIEPKAEMIEPRGTEGPVFRKADDSGLVGFDMEAVGGGGTRNTGTCRKYVKRLSAVINLPMYFDLLIE